MTGEHQKDGELHEHMHYHQEGFSHSHPHSHEHGHEHHGEEVPRAVLAISGVSFSYRSAKVLDTINLSVGPGEILAILGPNGVGKSTLLKCINRILKPETGSVVLAGYKDLAKMPGQEIAKHIGYVAQRCESSRMTVFDSVLLGRRPHISWKLQESDYAIVSDALEKFGLADMQLRYIDELSGGELQRVCVCRAIVQEPSVLLLDEPTSALDLARQIEILQLIRHIADRHTCTAVLTMHDLNLALRFADVFVFMSGGKIYEVCDKSGVTAELIEAVYGIAVEVVYHNGIPLVVPKM
ncbi:MAG TPA: ABC transporter ATP-binding protein [Methanocorpusculum sp.]|nr:ABC transporter ATP-binding protein [Methanocorpusculum sp.]